MTWPASTNLWNKTISADLVNGLVLLRWIPQQAMHLCFSEAFHTRLVVFKMADMAKMAERQLVSGFASGWNIWTWLQLRLSELMWHVWSRLRVWQREKTRCICRQVSIPAVPCGLFHTQLASAALEVWACNLQWCGLLLTNPCNPINCYSCDPDLAAAFATVKNFPTCLPYVIAAPFRSALQRCPSRSAHSL